MKKLAFMFVVLFAASCSLTGIDLPEIPQVLNIACVGEFESLIPASDNPPPPELVMQVFEGLTKFDEDLKVVPSLASLWESKDGKMIFHLKDTKFSDGTSLVADDVVNSLESLSKTSSSWVVKNVSGFTMFVQGRSGSVLGLEAIDDKTVSIQTNDAPDYFLEKLATPQAVIWKKDKAYPLGTGIFAIRKFVPGTKVTLLPNPHSGIKPKLEQVNFFIRSTYESAFEDFRQGRVHIAPIGEDLVKEAQKEALGRIATFDAKSFLAIGFNCKSLCFTDGANRKAVASAISFDDPEMIEWLGQHEAIPYFFDENYSCKTKVLSVAVPNGLADFGKIIAGQISKNTGIKTEVATYEGDRYIDALLNGKLDLFVFGMMTNTPDSYEILSVPVSESVISQALGYDTAGLVKLLKETNAANDRQEALKKAETLLGDDLPFFQTVRLRSNVVVSVSVSGYNPSAWGSQTLENCSLGR
jgi:ABC-type transport system substrate-binding protein